MTPIQQLTPVCGRRPLILSRSFRDSDDSDSSESGDTVGYNDVLIQTAPACMARAFPSNVAPSNPLRMLQATDSCETAAPDAIEAHFGGGQSNFAPGGGRRLAKAKSRTDILARLTEVENTPDLMREDEHTPTLAEQKQTLLKQRRELQALGERVWQKQGHGNALGVQLAARHPDAMEEEEEQAAQPMDTGTSSTTTTSSAHMFALTAED